MDRAGGHSAENGVIPIERITRAILLIRGQKVMLDVDLAELYGVETGALNRAVKRNIARFPMDFMFQLSEKEAEILKCQSGISRWGGSRFRPNAREALYTSAFPRPTAMQRGGRS